MLTIFAVPKPFEGHIGSIQRNAIRSWKHLGPECQVIICGDEVGCREVASDFEIDQIAEVERNEFGTPLLSSVFRRAEERAAHDLLCYANADLIFFSDLLDATRRVSAASRRFLIVGETWNLDVKGELALEDGDWEADLRRRALTAGTVRARIAIDFFVFRRGTIGQLPDFAVGRPAWDNWMVWRARGLRIPVVDVSPSTLVIHQEHGYGHVKQARGLTWEGPEGDRNRARLAHGQLFSLDDTTHRLTQTGLVRSPIGGLKRRIRTELLLHSRTVPLYHVLRHAYRPLRRVSFRG